MPTYTYTCKDCTITIEKRVKMENRNDEAYCDACGGILSRKLDRPGMVWSPTRNNGYSF